jgi:thioredoxin-like negative regulator of GroEL
LVEFYAPWCEACASAEASVRSAVARLGDVRVERVNVDREPERAARWNIDRLPAFMVVQGNRPLGKRVGLASADALVEFVRRASTSREAR